MDHFLAIRVFGRLVETGGFGRAADALRMPKSTVTKLIQSLEAELGVRLLERTTRRVTVTTEGAAYYEHTQQLLGELDAFETTLAGGQTSPIGNLRIDTGGSVAASLILPDLPDFRARYPGIRVQVGVTDRTVDLIGEGIDCAIRSTADDPNLVTKKIADASITLCATPGYFARRGTPDTPEAIERDGHEVVGYVTVRTGRPLPLRFRRDNRDVDIHVPTAVEVNESNAHTAAALAGLGMAQALTFTVARHIARGELVSVLDDWRPAPLPIFLVYPPARRHNARLRAFVDWLSKALPTRIAAAESGTVLPGNY